VILVHVKKKIVMTMKMKFAIIMHTQILNTICSQYERIFKSVLIIQNVCFSGKRIDSNFTEIRLHKICQTPVIIMITIICYIQLQTINMLSTLLGFDGMTMFARVHASPELNRILLLSYTCTLFA
jgi:hypothetical protein